MNDQQDTPTPQDLYTCTACGEEMSRAELLTHSPVCVARPAQKEEPGVAIADGKNVIEFPGPKEVEANRAMEWEEFNKPTPLEVARQLVRDLENGLDVTGFICICVSLDGADPNTFGASTYRAKLTDSQVVMALRYYEHETFTRYFQVR